MSRSDRLYVEEIIDACRRAREYTEGTSLVVFRSDQMRIDAVVRNLEIIGEASARLPINIREQSPAIPWRDIVAMRNLLIHAYFSVDVSIIWSVVREKLPELELQMLELLEKGALD